MSASLVPFPSGKPKYVLDTWPVMEWLKDRTRVADLFDGLIDRAMTGEIALLMSIVNLGEVYYTSAREWGVADAERILERMGQLPITIYPATNVEVMSAARLKAVHAISYADAFGASLAMQNRCPLITGDKDFLGLAEAGLMFIEWVGA